ncbi:MAG TPA: hypothetical protein VL588_00160 [Bdellovibrionota bacterium]|nr:hypothetical protein [Bdellovibrionota bacterium]
MGFRATTAWVMLTGILASAPAWAADDQVKDEAMTESPAASEPAPLDSTAAAPQTFKEHLHLQMNGTLGYVGTEVSSGSTVPSLLAFEIGAVGAYRFKGEWFAGLTTDFRFVNQYSHVDPTVGNRRGTRWSILSPTFGTKLGRLLLMLNIQFLGDYNLGNKTAGGLSVSYNNPFGGRLTGLFPVHEKIHAGMEVEYVGFAQQTTGPSHLSLTKKFNMWDVGLTVAYVF